jgi:hypothetical protein
VKTNVAVGAKELHLRRFFTRAILVVSRINISNPKWIVWLEVYSQEQLHAKVNPHQIWLEVSLAGEGMRPLTG